MASLGPPDRPYVRKERRRMDALGIHACDVYVKPALGAMAMKARVRLDLIGCDCKEIAYRIYDHLGEAAFRKLFQGMIEEKQARAARDAAKGET